MSVKLGGMQDTPHFAQVNFTITDKAVKRVAALTQKKSMPSAALRVYITGGGCSGFQYGFKFEEQLADDDITIFTGVVTVAIDPLSFQYLEGAKLDYLEDLQGARFVINNPNATTTCGCGSSFSI